MPAAWERQPTVVTGILHTDVTTIAWALGFRNLILPGPVVVVAGMPYDHARNTICMRVLESGADYCFMLDSDCIPPHDAVPRLIKISERLKKQFGKYQIVSGLYCRRSPPEGVPVMIRRGQWVTKFRQGSLVEVDVVGSGCMLLHRETLEQMPPQRPEAGKAWFDWRVDMQSLCPPGTALSEDFTMCLHAKNTLGIRTWVDSSIICRHVGLGEAGLGTFRPAEANPTT